MPRIELTCDTDFYCSAAGFDSNDGLTPATPKRNTQAMINEISANYDLRGHRFAIRHAPGAYQPSYVRGKFVGQGDRPRIVGSLTRGACTITGSNCFALDSGADMLIEGFTVSAIGSSALNSQMHSTLWYRDIDFGPTYGGHHIQTQKQGTSFYLSKREDGSPSGYWISGAAIDHIYVNGNSVAYLTELVNSQGLVFGPGISFDAFINAIDKGALVAHTNQFFGSFVGCRAFSQRSSCVDGLASLPGAGLVVDATSYAG